MQKLISYFDVDWNRKTRSGLITLTFDDRTRVELRVSMEELSLLCGLLRSEKPVYFEPKGETFSTHPAAVDDAR